MTANRLAFYAQTIGQYEAMSPVEKQEFRVWERVNVDGGGELSSTDWPGFERLGARFGWIPPGTPPRVKQVTRTVPEALRWEVWQRDNFTCQHCGAEKFLTVDHVVPQVKGGSDDPQNLQTLCKGCNSRKGPR